MENSYGVKEGFSTNTISKALIFECDPFTSNAEIWLGSKREKACIKSIEDKSRYDKVIDEIDAGAKITLDRARYMNGLDSEINYIEVSVLAGHASRKYILYSFHARKLMGL